MKKLRFIFVLFLITVSGSFIFASDHMESELDKANLEHNSIKYSLTSPEIVIQYDLLAKSEIKITLIHESCSFIKVYDIGLKSDVHNEFLLDKEKLPEGNYYYFIESENEIKSGSFIVTGFMAPQELVNLPPAYINEEDNIVEINYELKYPCHVKMILFHEDAAYMKVLEDTNRSSGKYILEMGTNEFPDGLYTCILESDFGISYHSFYI